MEENKKLKEDFDFATFANECINSFKEMYKGLNRLNIIVAGKTGVGKSTLINAVFGEDVAQTGTGKPVTQHMEKYVSKNGLLAIYDTKGLELSAHSQEEIFQEISNTIDTQHKKNDLNEAVHCLWYCVSASSNRVENEEIELLRKFSDQNSLQQVPIIVIVTKCYAKKTREEMIQFLKGENLNIAGIVPVHAINYEIDDEFTVSKFGLEELIKLMKDVLPEQLRTTFINMQKADLNAKIEYARSLVNKYTAAASALAATPVPFSDAFTLVPTQISMISHITVCFGLELDKSIITGLVSSIAGTAATTLIGKTLVSNLIKFIPGLGSIAGGVISASTAGLLTKALGEAYIVLMTEIAKGNLTLDDLLNSQGTDLLASLMKEKLKELAQ